MLAKERPKPMSRENTIVAVPGLVLAFFIVIVLAAFGLYTCRSSGEIGDRVLPPPTEGMAEILIDGHKYLIVDHDRDGSVDCFSRMGFAGAFGPGTYRAPGKVTCTNFDGFTHVMSGPMRDALSALLARKSVLHMEQMSPLDENGDGTVDCLIAVHGGFVVARRDQSACASLDTNGARIMSAGEVADAAGVLAAEKDVRQILKNGG